MLAGCGITKLPTFLVGPDIKAGRLKDRLGGIPANGTRHLRALHAEPLPCRQDASVYRLPGGPVRAIPAWIAARVEMPALLDLRVLTTDNACMTDDLRRYAPATVRNRDPIWAFLQRHLPQRGLVLEIASGSGEHVTHFARAAGPDLVFQPSDPEPSARVSIDAWVEAARVHNVRPAIALDAAAADWPIANADAVVCINMIHIAPWDAAEGLMRGASGLLSPGAPLYLYGPYRRGRSHTSPSNERFDRELRLQNAAWGVRDIEAVVDLAELHGFGAPIIEAMPANNLSLLFRRLGTA